MAIIAPITNWFSTQTNRLTNAVVENSRFIRKLLFSVVFRAGLVLPAFLMFYEHLNWVARVLCSFVVLVEPKYYMVFAIGELGIYQNVMRLFVGSKLIPFLFSCLSKHQNFNFFIWGLMVSTYSAAILLLPNKEMYPVLGKVLRGLIFRVFNLAVFEDKVWESLYLLAIVIAMILLKVLFVRDATPLMLIEPPHQIEVKDEVHQVPEEAEKEANRIIQEAKDAADDIIKNAQSDAEVTKIIRAAEHKAGNIIGEAYTKAVNILESTIRGPKHKKAILPSKVLTDDAKKKEASGD